MDDAVVGAMSKWPGVPAVYGWLRLDRRGRWRMRVETGGCIRFELIGNDALQAFISRNYEADTAGRWFFQNGPQRVYVGLDCTPFVYRAEGGGFVDHCGRRVCAFDGAWLDEEGSLLLREDGRVGLLDDRDLAALAAQLEAGYVRSGNRQLRLGHLLKEDIERRFSFVRDPLP